jgi:hypothetical protein
MRTIELIYDQDCPNVDAARAVLRQALHRAGLAVEWKEWDRGDPESPEYTRQYGSPTILVDGRDVAGAGTESDANCCRVYSRPDGRLNGVPEADAVLQALGGAPR